MYPLFPLGRIVSTRSVFQDMQDNAEFKNHCSECLSKHALGKWGNVSDHDSKENDDALKQNLRLFSVYDSGRWKKIWIITEADRSSTTILYPEDY